MVPSSWTEHSCSAVPAESISLRKDGLKSDLNRKKRSFCFFSAIFLNSPFTIVLLQLLLLPASDFWFFWENWKMCIVVLENLLQIVPFYPPAKYFKKQLNTQKLTQNVFHSVFWFFFCRDVDPTCQWVCHEFSDEGLAGFGFEVFPTQIKQLYVHLLNI